MISIGLLFISSASSFNKACFIFCLFSAVVTSSTVMKSSKSSLLSRPLVSLSGTIFVEFSKNKTSLDGENFNS